MRNIVIDANVAAAVLIDLAYSSAAREAVAEPGRIIAPDILLHEFANALWRLVGAGRMTENFAHQALTGLEAIVSDLVAGSGLSHDALRIAIELRHPVYDCFYLALAVQQDATLLTADRRLAARVADTEFAGRLHLITA